MVVQPLTSQTSLHRIRSIDCNGVELTVLGHVESCSLEGCISLDSLAVGWVGRNVSLATALCPLLSWVFLVVWSVNSCDWKHEMYVDKAALPTLWQYFEEGPFLFQQDNCSIHTSRLAQTCFDEMGVQKLDWHSQNLALNPIEQILGGIRVQIT
ncbi:hypothetical protein TNCV_914491 [Trichonephila clavipes]|nr:hypothetical protein TNCV_914491 [Trichonephila clavipes]